MVGDSEGGNKDGDGSDTSSDGDSAPQGGWDGGVRGRGRSSGTNAMLKLL